MATTTSTVKSFAVTLNFNEIEFNVKYGCMKQAKLANLSGDVLKEYTFTVADDSWLSRAIETAISSIMKKFAWAITESATAASDAINSQAGSYVITFNLPRDWHGQSTAVVGALNNFITQFCIAEFLKLAGSGNYAALKTEALTLLEDECSKVINSYDLPTKQTYLVATQL